MSDLIVMEGDRRIEGSRRLNLSSKLDLSSNQIFIVEKSASVDVAPDQDAVLEFWVADDACLDLCMVIKKKVSVTLSVVIGSRARVTMTHAMLAPAQTQTKFSLEGEGAQVVDAELCSAQGSGEHNLSTTVTHKAPNTCSRIDMRSLLDDQASVKAHASMVIEKQAEKAIARVTDHALILSKNARAETIPAMEILAHDAQASHAASSSRISSEHLFYLTQRGILESDARKLIALGFLKSIVKGSRHEDAITTEIEQQWNTSRSN